MTLKITKSKGEYGYIDEAKKRKLVMTCLSFVAVFIIFITGVIIYHTNKSLFAVIAALSALPAAKLLTMYIAMMPYKTGDMEIYERLKKTAALNSEYQAVIGADFIISSTDKSMGIQFAYIINGKALCLTEYKKTSAKETETYLKKIFDNENCQYSAIKVYDDRDRFLKHVEAVCMETGKEYTDKRIFEKLCTYSI